jgi:acetylornithine deacetylase/succinyl-diaminopimelate desuccinylase-like protein
LGDLRGMRAVVDRFSDQVLAYIVLEGMALGQVYHRGLGVERYVLSVRTPGGHSWVDYGIPSAINELSALVSKLACIPLPERPRTILNVGVISGGTSVNTIAAEAQLELDLRSEDGEVLDYLVSQVKSLVGSAGKPDVSVTLERVGLRPAGSIPEDHPLVLLARRTLMDVGVQPSLAIGSTDANIPLGKGIPSICVGLAHGSGAHTLKEYIDTGSLMPGLTQLVNLVLGIYHELA